MADRTTLSNFRATYEVKNGEIGSDEVLNRAVDVAKQEIDKLWNWATSNTSDTLPTGTLVELMFDDSTQNALDAGMDKVTRSARWIQLHISNLSSPGSDIYYTWNIDRIKNYVQTTTIDGGSWN